MEKENNKEGKKTMGRRKIPIEKITKKTSLQVTFTKRRMGLFKKASELCVLCGSEIAILVQSPADKIFSFGNPSVDYVINRFQTGATSPLPNSRTTNENSRIKYAEAALKLQGEIAKKNKIIKEKETGEKLWWEEPYIENMELHELEEFSQALEHLKSNVLNRADEMQNLKMASSCNWASTSSNNFLPITDNDEIIKYHNNMQIQCHGGDFNHGINNLLEDVKVEAEMEKLDIADFGCSSNWNLVNDQAFDTSYSNPNIFGNI